MLINRDNITPEFPEDSGRRVITPTSDEPVMIKKLFTPSARLQKI